MQISQPDPVLTTDKANQYTLAVKYCVDSACCVFDSEMMCWRRTGGELYEPLANSRSSK